MPKKSVKRKPVELESRFASGYQVEHGITQSILAKWANCRVAAQHSFDNWCTNAPRMAPFFGSMTHQALEWWYQGKYKTVRGCLKAIEKHWRTKAAKECFDAQATEEMMAFEHILFPEYVDHWGKRDTKKRWAYLEPTFDILWNGWRLRGKCDGVFRLGRGKGKLWLLETKTASQLNPENLALKLSFDFQNLFYVTAMSQLLGEPIVGVLYNVIKKPTLRLAQKDGGDWSNYIERVREDVQEDPNKYFARFEAPYPQEVREEFEEELLNKLELFHDWCVHPEDQPTYRNESACTARWNCEFLRGCSAGDMVGFVQRDHLFGELADE